MAAKKDMTLEVKEIEQENSGPDWGEVTLDDSLTVKVEQKQATYKGPMVEIYLPKLEEEGGAGMKVDQYEHVTIANEVREWTWYVKRGVRQQVPVPVFVQLKQKYDSLDKEI